MRLEETEKELKRFLNSVIKDARANLQKKNASGKLSQSLKGHVKVSKNSVELDILAESYADFVDKGVSGTKRKFNTPYSFKSKMPPPRVFNQWSVRRGLAPRDEKGKFMNRKSLMFALSRSIQRKGIKPSLFLTNAYKKNIADLDKNIEAKFGLDSERVINTIIKNI